MIEATSTAILAAPFLRQATLGTNADSVSAEMQSSGVVSAPFVSPAVSFDTEYNTAVLQIRDSETGEVVGQIPSENRLEDRRQFSEERDNNLNRSQSASSFDAGSADRGFENNGSGGVARSAGSESLNQQLTLDRPESGSINTGIGNLVSGEVRITSAQIASSVSDISSASGSGETSGRGGSVSISA